jgi:hypothetical protein
MGGRKGEALLKRRAFLHRLRSPTFTLSDDPSGYLPQEEVSQGFPFVQNALGKAVIGKADK